MNKLRECMIDGSYGEMFYGSEDSYQSYLASRVSLARRYYKGGKVFSVGCGDGRIESALPFDVLCHDIHDAAKVLHPELNFTSKWPSEKFDLVLCFGAVINYIHPKEQGAFVQKLLDVTFDDGTILISGCGYAGMRPDIEGNVYPCAYPSHQKIKVI